MNTRRLSSWACALATLAVSAGSRAQVQEKQPFPPGPAVARSCSALAQSALSAGTLERASVTDQPLGALSIYPFGYLPAHCELHGTTSASGHDANIDFVMRLPYAWNGQFFFQGGQATDGLDGSAVGDPLGKQGYLAIQRGYAVASTDAGHDLELLDLSRTLTHFGVSPRDRSDYAHRAVGVVTSSAKELIARFYGAAPQHSFFVGCSNGGRQAMMAATRYASEFDGVLAGAPPLHMSGALLQAPATASALKGIAPNSPADAFSSAELDEVSRRIVARCDGLDGKPDGLVLDPLACDQNIAAYTAWCGLWPGSCLGLSPLKFTALSAMLAGPRAGGAEVYPGLMWDPSVNAGSFRNWRLGGTLPSFFELLGASGIPELASVPPALQCSDGLYTMSSDGRFWNGASTKTPAQCSTSRARNWAYLKSVDATSAWHAMHAAPSGFGFAQSGADELDVPGPLALAAFKARGGKLIVFSGTADPLVAYRDLTAYWDALRSGVPGADDFAALYAVPGMSHCGGGRSPDQFDLFNVLENWVKRGVGEPVPWEVLAHTRPSANTGDLDELANGGARSAVLCRHPRRAHWNGTAWVCTP